MTSTSKISAATSLDLTKIVDGQTADAADVTLPFTECEDDIDEARQTVSVSADDTHVKNLEDAIVGEAGITKVTVIDDGADESLEVTLDPTGITAGYAPRADGADGCAWGVSLGEYALIREEQTAGTDGGTFTAAAWRTRVLTTQVVDTGGDIALASNQMTVEAGTYRCRISAPAYRAGLHQAILYNVTDTAEELVGTSEFAESGAAATQSRSLIVGRFTLAAQKVLEVRHYGSVTQANDGFGLALGQTTEIYTIVELWKED